jgi:hypothetical protein
MCSRPWYIGNVSIADLSYIGNSQTDSLYGTNINSDQAQFAQFSASNTWGITGQDYTSLYDTYDENGSGYTQAVYTNKDQSAFWYRFIDQSPLAGALTTVTDRTINCTADCQSCKPALVAPDIVQKPHVARHLDIRHHLEMF